MGMATGAGWADGAGRGNFAALATLALAIGMRDGVDDLGQSPMNTGHVGGIVLEMPVARRDRESVVCRCIAARSCQSGAFRLTADVCGGERGWSTDGGRERTSFSRHAGH